MRTADLHRLHRVTYENGMMLQQRLVEMRQAGTIDDQLYGLLVSALFLVVNTGLRFRAVERRMTELVHAHPAGRNRLQIAIPIENAVNSAKLDELRRPGAPFPLRLTRFFWRDGEAGFRALFYFLSQF